MISSVSGEVRGGGWSTVKTTKETKTKKTEKYISQVCSCAFIVWSLIKLNCVKLKIKDQPKFEKAVSRATLQAIYECCPTL